MNDLNDSAIEQTKVYLNIKNILFGNLKRKVVSIFFINMMIVVLLLVIGAVQFETIDDYMIYELLSGKWGQATSYVIYINIFLSRVLLTLFNVFPTINWYVLMLLTTHVLSFTILGYLVNKKYKNGMKLYLIIIITMYIPFLIFLQYTSQAAILILVSCLFATSIIKNNEKKYKLLIPGILIIFGSLIRFGALMYVLPYVGVMILISIIKKKFNKKDILLIIIFYTVTLASSLMLKVIHTHLYNASPIYKEYLEYSNVRTLIHDYLGNNYEKNIDVYETAGWSRNDFLSMAFFNNADNIVFSKDNMEYIIKNVKITFPNNILQSFFSVCFFPYLILLFIAVYISIKEGNKENIIVAILSIIIELAFITMGKVNIRTCLTNYVVAIVIMVSNLGKIEIVDTKRITVKLIFEITAITMLIVTDILVVNENKNSSLERSYSQFIDYANSNTENAYIYSRKRIK